MPLEHNQLNLEIYHQYQTILQPLFQYLKGVSIQQVVVSLHKNHHKQQLKDQLALHFQVC